MLDKVLWREFLWIGFPVTIFPPYYICIPPNLLSHQHHRIWSKVKLPPSSNDRCFLHTPHKQLRCYHLSPLIDTMGSQASIRGRKKHVERDTNTTHLCPLRKNLAENFARESKFKSWLGSYLFVQFPSNWLLDFVKNNYPIKSYSKM